MRARALERLTPPWEAVEILERTGGITNGSRVTMRLRLGPCRWRWVSEHRDYQENAQFCDVQIAGPLARWEHLHRFAPDGPAASYLEDRITYALPLGMVSRLLAGPFVRQKLNQLFAYRHRITMQDLAAHAAYREEPR
jgi:ligand-binding SRPBCC domain-containing protein